MILFNIKKKEGESLGDFKELTSDQIWKNLIENFFEDFMNFFAGDISQDIAFENGFERLDKELGEILLNSEGHDRRCDELLKVKMKSGNGKWVFVHLEIQGYRDENFAERMFEYYYRIRDRYHEKIYPLVIYTHEIVTNHPDHYKENFYKMSLVYKYPVYKIVKQKEADLMKQDNPFALVVLAGLYTLKTKRNQAERYRFKKELVKLLAEKKWEKEKIRDLFLYIDGIIKINGVEKNEEIVEEFRERLKLGDEDMKLDWSTSNLAVEARKEGKLLGRAEGRVEGLNCAIVAIDLLKKNTDVETIAKMSGMPIEKINELKKSVL